MGGVCGVLNLDGRPAERGVVEAMTRALAHRGPDGEGLFFDGALGLGHRRLAVIDLSPAGGQPLSTPDGRLTISYNGAIYNYRELRTDLESRGRRFRSHGDAEVALYAYEAWGPQCLERFNGMFSLAVWDSARREMFLARDRYGVKPLYYALAGRGFIFGSEQKALMAHPALRRRLDHEGLLEYFTFQNFFTDKTLLKGVHMFPPGHWAVISADQPVLKPRRFWDFCFQENESLAEDDCLEELDRLLRQAVGRQLAGDVEIGTYLSGGLDSGSVTAIAAGRRADMKSFTCGCDLNSASGLELNFDERAKAEYMSYLFRTEHYEMVLKAGDMERVLPALARCIEEPRVGQSYPNYFAAYLASRFVRVVLSGAGGDELFAGYPWRYYRAAQSRDFNDFIDNYYLFWQRLAPNATLRKMFGPIRAEVAQVWTRDIFQNVFSGGPEKINRPEDYINHCLYFEAKTFLHGVLTVEDKLSMAHGLETRAPFLDNDLVDFAQSLPVRFKLRNLQAAERLDENDPRPKKKALFEQTSDGKLILRRAASRFVPEEVSRAAKQGFSAPDASWFKGESIDYVKKALYGKSARIYEYFDYEIVTGLLDEHLSSRCNRRLLIWSFLNFEHWLKEFLP